ncbi:hypothetical protein ABIE79_010092 [Bradyrhizobium diazoefficiens]
MRRLIILSAMLLSACADGNPPEPRQVCTMVTAQYSCGRGGICEQCGRWEIGCPKPLELDERADGTHQLICRLKKPDTCILSATPGPDNCNVSAIPPDASPLR